MLTIICGEDTKASREHFQKIKDEYRAKGFEIKILTDSRYESLREQMTETASLFTPKQAFFTEHFVKQLKLKRNKELFTKVDNLVKNPDIVWFDWEQYQGREISNPKSAQIQDFKLPTSIFKLLDECYPSNLKGFVRDMSILLENQDEGFIYAMLCKHIKSLILAKSNALPSTSSPWQKKKLATQASLWPSDKLISFYEGLTRIDVSIKTSNNPHGIKRSIEILTCYLL